MPRNQIWRRIRSSKFCHVVSAVILISRIKETNLPSSICSQIGDFGMSRDLANNMYYHSKGGKIPVRWTAPEVSWSVQKTWRLPADVRYWKGQKELCFLVLNNVEQCSMWILKIPVSDLICAFHVSLASCRLSSTESTRRQAMCGPLELSSLRFSLWAESLTTEHQ